MYHHLLYTGGYSEISAKDLLHRVVYEWIVDIVKI